MSPVNKLWIIASSLFMSHETNALFLVASGRSDSHRRCLAEEAKEMNHFDNMPLYHTALSAHDGKHVVLCVGRVATEDNRSSNFTEREHCPCSE